MMARFTHAFRERNCAADKLGNLGAEAAGFFWWSDSPSDLLPMLLRDAFGFLSY